MRPAGLEADAFIAVVKGTISDGEVCDWVQRHVKKSEAEKAAFNHFILNHGREEDPELRARLKMRKEQSGFSHRNDITTFVDYIDADEKRERVSESLVFPGRGLTLIGIAYPPDNELAARAKLTMARRDED